MATGDYCTLSELKLRIWPDGTEPDNDSDVIFQSIITAVSRAIDTMCGRRFWTTAADETRYFTTSDGEFLFPDLDVISITTIYIDDTADGSYGTTLSTDDYYLLPPNAALDGRPYNYLRMTPTSVYAFPTHQNGVKVVGKFGWSSIPAAVREACLLQAQRIWKRKDAVFGIISNPVGGEMRLLEQLDPDVQLLLWSYRKVV